MKQKQILFACLALALVAIGAITYNITKPQEEFSAQNMEGFIDYDRTIPIDTPDLNQDEIIIDPNIEIPQQ